MRGNTLKVNIDGVIRGQVITAGSLYQYDYGQILLLEGDLPASYDVHFSNSNMTGTTIKRTGSPDGAISIPDELLETGLDIYAFIYVHAGEHDGRTLLCINIPVKERSKPIN